MQVANFLTINPATVPNGTVGASYSQVLTASGGSGGSSWGITAGALPGGLTLGPSNGDHRGHIQFHRHRHGLLQHDRVPGLHGYHRQRYLHHAVLAAQRHRQHLL